VDNSDLLKVDLMKKNKVGKTYQQILDDIKLKAEREKEEII
jgi:hypothetical protein